MSLKRYMKPRLRVANGKKDQPPVYVVWLGFVAKVNQWIEVCRRKWCFMSVVNQLATNNCTKLNHYSLRNQLSDHGIHLPSRLQNWLHLRMNKIDIFNHLYNARSLVTTIRYWWRHMNPSLCWYLYPVNKRVIAHRGIVFQKPPRLHHILIFSF